MASNIFYVEKELGAYITDEYPLIKLISQIEHLHKHQEEEKREMEKSQQKSRGTIG